MVYHKNGRRRRAGIVLPLSGVPGLFLGRMVTTGLVLSIVLLSVLGLLFNMKTTSDVTNCPCLELNDRQIVISSPDRHSGNRHHLPGQIKSPSTVVVVHEITKSRHHLQRQVKSPLKVVHKTSEKDKKRDTATHAHKLQPGWWRNHTRSTCQKLGLNTNQSNLVPGMLGNVLVDENHKILYCQIAKVASTNLGKIFAIVAGKFNGTNPNDIKSRDVHWKYNTLQTHLDAFPKDVMLTKLERYYKFVFVRDPLERLVSGYRNKFLGPSSSYFTYINKRIVLKYRQNSTQTGGVTFPEFVSYLVDKKRKGAVPMNGHWQPMYELCRPCEARYDFVGKLHTLEKDVSHILEANNLTDIVDISQLPQSYRHHTADLDLGEYYSQVPRPLLLLLLEKYQPDYAIFDFQIPTVIQKLLTGSEQDKRV